MKKICIIFGTRPEIIKLAPLIKILENKKKNFFLIFTNQHYDKNMSKIFFSEFKIKKPKHILKVKKNKNLSFVNSTKEKIIKILDKEKPDIVIVQGDTNTSLSGALAVKTIQDKIKHPIYLAHIEAGLRSYDYRMPEEFNRTVIDHFSDILFAPTNIQKKILITEGVSSKKIFLVGNTIVDALKIITSKKKKFNKPTVVLTLHRSELLSDRPLMKKIFEMLNSVAISNKLNFEFFCHPRTQKIIKKYKIRLNKNFRIKEPVNYKVFLKYIKGADLILSDSGGIQEEACILKKSLITLRFNTERPETLNIGANFLSMREELISKRIKFILRSNPRWDSPYGNNVSNKIYKIIFNEKNTLYN